MTFKELKEKCEAEGFQYAYGNFKKETLPPYLVAVEMDSNNFLADDRVYKKIKQVRLEYYFINKDLIEQNKIENHILENEVWYKTEETYIDTEKMWQVSYFFEIKEEN